MGSFPDTEIDPKVLPKFIRLCMETPCWCPFEGHKYGRRKPKRKNNSPVFDKLHKVE